MDFRFLLVSFVALATVACATSPSSSSSPSGGPGGRDIAGRQAFVYVGGYRPEISIFRLDLSSGTLTPAGSAPAGKAPSYLALDPHGRYLYSLDEVDDGRVSSFAIDQRTGALAPLSTASSAGVGPAHLWVDGTGRWLLVANYADKKPGTIAVLPIGQDGRLGPAVDTRDFGPGTMPHMIATDPTNRFVFVPCKGGPYVAQLRFEAATGKLTPGSPDRVPAPAGSGPRHIAFHPGGRVAYVINEQALTMTAYTLDGATGRLAEIQTLPTIPADAPRKLHETSTAEVHVHPSGKFLYGSNRGYNSIVIYRLDENGRMSLAGEERRGIDKPRGFDLDPTGTLLLSANQLGDSVTVFRIDQETGALEPIGAPTPAGKQPSFVAVVFLRP